MSENWAELESRYFFPVGKRLPVTLVKGEGCRVWGEDGREYLDFLAGIASVSLGHCHPEVVKAVQEQASTLMHVSNYYYTLPQIKLAKLLCEQTGLDRGFFCNSGGEAGGGWIKLAREGAGRRLSHRRFPGEGALRRAGPGRARHDLRRQPARHPRGLHRAEAHRRSRHPGAGREEGG